LFHCHTAFHRVVHLKMKSLLTTSPPSCIWLDGYWVKYRCLTLASFLLPLNNDAAFILCFYPNRPLSILSLGADFPPNTSPKLEAVSLNLACLHSLQSLWARVISSGNCALSTLYIYWVPSSYTQHKVSHLLEYDDPHTNLHIHLKRMAQKF